MITYQTESQTTVNVPPKMKMSYFAFAHALILSSATVFSISHRNIPSYLLHTQKHHDTDMKKGHKLAYKELL
jgi:hypothetical protein